LVNKLIIANLGHRPIRTLLSILAIAVEVTMMLTLVGVSFGTLHNSAQRVRGVGADVLVRPRNSSILALSTAPIPEKMVGWLSAQPHVSFAMGTTIQPLGGFDSVTGLDLDEFRKLNGGFRYLSGGPFIAPDEIIVDQYYAREKSLKVGSQISLMNHTWRVAGIFESGKLARICMRLQTLRELTGNPGTFSQIYLKLDDPHRASAVVEDLRGKLPGYPIYTLEEFTSLLSISNVGLLKNFIGVVIGVAVIVGFIVVFMGMYTAVMERTREIGILKAVGASPGFILNILLRETLLLAVIGTILGILFTYGTQWLMLHAVPASLTQETVYWWWPIAAAIAIVGALLGALFPVVKAVKQDAIEALAYE
jgi:putative ABC transport system permease protein